MKIWKIEGFDMGTKIRRNCWDAGSYLYFNGLAWVNDREEEIYITTDIFFKDDWETYYNGSEYVKQLFDNETIKRSHGKRNQDMELKKIEKIDLESIIKKYGLTYSHKMILFETAKRINEIIDWINKQ